MTLDHDAPSRQRHLLDVCRSALAGRRGVLSTGEELAAALVLNRPDWLAEAGYTVVDALQRIADTWGVADLAVAAKAMKREAAAAALTKEELARAAVRPEAPSDPETELDYTSNLITYGEAPGYRDAFFIFELKEIGAAAARPFRARIYTRPQDGERIVRHLLRVHRFAWRTGGDGPIDRQPDETRPRWIDAP